MSLNTVDPFIRIFIKSIEKGLITKEYIIITDTHLYFIFKWALHFGTLVIKLLKSYFKLQLLPQHYEPVFF